MVISISKPKRSHSGRCRLLTLSPELQAVLESIRAAVIWHPKTESDLRAVRRLMQLNLVRKGLVPCDYYHIS